MKKLQALIAVAIIAILAIAIAPVAAQSDAELAKIKAHDQVAELRMTLKESAPLLAEYSLPYNILTAADMCIENGEADMVPVLLGSHFKNALAYEEKKDKISSSAMKEMLEEGNGFSLA